MSAIRIALAFFFFFPFSMKKKSFNTATYFSLPSINLFGRVPIIDQVARIYPNIREVKVNSWPRVKRCVTLTSGTDRLLHTSYRIIASFPAAPSIPLLDDTPLSLLFHMTARPRRPRARRELAFVPNALCSRARIFNTRTCNTRHENVDAIQRQQATAMPSYGKDLPVNSPIRGQRRKRRRRVA